LFFIALYILLIGVFVFRRLFFIKIEIDINK
jgi:hypothetical protein